MELRSRSEVQRTVWTLAVAAILLLGTVFMYGSPRAGNDATKQEKESAHDSSGGPSTSLNDQTDLSVTVYNSNIALVRDVRGLLLPSGLFRLKLMDIAATVNPATVHFRSLNEPDKLGVLEQNYEYDLLEPAKLLNKYVGKEVTLVRSVMENGSTKREEVREIEPDKTRVQRWTTFQQRWGASRYGRRRLRRATEPRLSESSPSANTQPQP